MLKHLSIKNIALIDKIEVDFSKGLNILTGETGAGKSIIIDSINAVLGSRISKDMIRTGQESAQIEAVFECGNSKVSEYLNDNGLSDENTIELILAREFNTNGKNVCRINGRMVTTTILKEIGQLIIDIHGQHDNQSLLNVNTHLDLLDSFGGEKIEKVKNEYTKLYEDVKEIKKKIEQLGGDARERERKIDLLRFQLDEISSAKLKINEDKELEEQRDIMNNSEKIVSSVENAYNTLYSGSMRQSVIDSLNIVIKELGSIQKYDEKIPVFLDKAHAAYYSCEDLVEEIRNYKETLDFDPALLEKMEDRLDCIYKLKRKYGESIEEILAYKRDIENQLEELSSSQEKLDKYAKELEIIQNDLDKKANELSSIRNKIALEIESKIVNELEELEMKKTQFKVKFEEFNDQNKYSSKGIDKVEFLISPNAGESLKPLSKIASGGEMSRIMLAIKTILASVDEIPTLIFDEIDIGISGKVAQMVGQKLSYIGKSHQVICITHLPQIASMADNHFLIEKNVEENTTKTVIKKLNIQEKEHEIARIIGGVKITETTLKHAQEMIELAQQRKNA